MRKVKSAALLLGMVAVANCASAEPYRDPFKPPAGFFTGSNYETLSPEARLRYLDGIMDGFLYAPMFSDGDELRRTDQLARCNAALGLTDIQLRKIVNDYLDRHPDDWGLPMNVLVSGAYGETCKRAGHSFF